MPRPANTSGSLRAEGAMMGASAALAIGYGAHWSQLGDDGWHVWLIALGGATALGAFSWAAFQAPQKEERPARLFIALFGAAVALLAGAFASYPFGALFGVPGGAVGAMVAMEMAAFWHKRVPHASGWSWVGSACVGSLVGLLAVVGCSP